ncbi:hypothetical protein DSCO28_58610 [Desulfosarcina ovata subsp. sediminis]|uniref:Uncharacterized protein n=1 Tax=Desulfosarcina ovata subsp. sediminis TaxID=885957 RepID=A0A5K7ZYE3_9BACT|nr:hypothetical protein [Desulfosarcina ovata]BBO85295.1 hypothetical protein DSCO28_58610 [Desulfosarcina ovata subsp. sediminis]
MTLSDQEWEQRILCSDGNCIGVIGSDGRCKECGKPYDGQLPLPPDDGGAIREDDNDSMTSPQIIDPVLTEALTTVCDFIRQVTGTAPTSAELADALKRYFVLNEIKEHILMVRDGGAEDSKMH